MYEPAPGRETPEEKRLREVKIEVELPNTNDITDIEEGQYRRTMDAERSHFSIFSKAMEKEARERLLREIEEARKRVKSVQYCIRTYDIHI